MATYRLQTLRPPRSYAAGSNPVLLDRDRRHHRFRGRPRFDLQADDADRAGTATYRPQTRGPQPSYAAGKVRDLVIAIAVTTAPARLPPLRVLADGAGRAGTATSRKPQCARTPLAPVESW
jgi:hypothetical protein